MDIANSWIISEDRIISKDLINRKSFIRCESLESIESLESSKNFENSEIINRSQSNSSNNICESIEDWKIKLSDISSSLNRYMIYFCLESIKWMLESSMLSNELEESTYSKDKSKSIALDHSFIRTDINARNMSALHRANSVGYKEDSLILGEISNEEGKDYQLSEVSEREDSFLSDFGMIMETSDLDPLPKYSETIGLKPADYDLMCNDMDKYDALLGKININPYGINFDRIICTHSDEEVGQDQIPSYYKGQWGYIEGSNTKVAHGKGIKVWNNNKVFIGEFNNGAIHGAGRLINSDGTCETGTWVNNILQGEVNTYYSDGKWSKSTYLNGKKDGFVKHFYNTKKDVTLRMHHIEDNHPEDFIMKNSILRQMNVYENDQKHGIQVDLWKDGHTTKQIQHFNRGVPTGEPKLFYRDGSDAMENFCIYI